jgi:hypothetical protein
MSHRYVMNQIRCIVLNAVYLLSVTRVLVSFLQRRIVFSNLVGSSARNLRLEQKKMGPSAVNMSSLCRSISGAAVKAAEQVESTLQNFDD